MSANFSQVIIQSKEALSGAQSFGNCIRVLTGSNALGAGGPQFESGHPDHNSADILREFSANHVSNSYRPLPIVTAFYRDLPISETQESHKIGRSLPAVSLTARCAQTFDHPAIPGVRQVGGHHVG